MMIDGHWRENITCPHCHHRHPASVTCARAQNIVGKRRAERAERAKQPAKENEWDGVVERRDYSEFAKLVLGEERYGSSPCQAHPFELIVEYVRELEARKS